MLKYAWWNIHVLIKTWSCSSSLSGTNAVCSHSLKHRQTLLLEGKWQNHILLLKMSVWFPQIGLVVVKFTGIFNSFSLALKVLLLHYSSCDVASVSSTVYKPGLLSLTSHYSRSTLTIFYLCTVYCIYLRPYTPRTIITLTPIETHNNVFIFIALNSVLSSAALKARVL